MVSQRDIAAELGVNQATVSLALRGDRSISAEMRQRVHDVAERMGYQPRMYVNTLASNVRNGEVPNDNGVIGLLIESHSQEDWYKNEFYRVFHQGVLQRAKELGIRVESFFLQQPGMNASRIDQILYSRGINGIILAPPGRAPDLQWERYATIVASMGWEGRELNRVACNQLQNYITVFQNLLQLGYTRIGTALDNSFVKGLQKKTKWHTGYLECQHDLSQKDRIPVFKYNALPRNATSCENEAEVLYDRFCKWFAKWQPEVIITLLGAEMKWLKKMKLKVPEDVGLACLSQPVDSSYARIDERGDIVGATALELVATQVARNEFGLPTDPKVMSIEGRWANGTTLRKKKLQ